MDLITLAMTKAYTDQKVSSLEQSGQAGCVETKIITYDGNGEKIDLLGDERTFAKISDNPVDFTGAKRAVMYDRDRARTYPVDIMVGGEAGMIAVADGNGELIFAVSVSQDNEFGIAPGVYMFDGSITTNSSEASEWAFYCASIELETIHPIDPKFIPGAVLPVVELETELAFTSSVSTTSLSVADSEKISNALSTCDAFLCSARALSNRLTILVTKNIEPGDSVKGFSTFTLLQQNEIILINTVFYFIEGEGWRVQLQPVYLTA